MRKQKLTPWFPATVKPVRKGLYEVVRPRVASGYPVQTFLLWDGEEWQHTKHSGGGAAWVGSFAHMGWPGEMWRGLAKASA